MHHSATLFRRYILPGFVYVSVLQGLAAFIEDAENQGLRKTIFDKHCRVQLGRVIPANPAGRPCGIFAFRMPQGWLICLLKFPPVIPPFHIRQPFIGVQQDRLDGLAGPESEKKAVAFIPNIHR